MAQKGGASRRNGDANAIDIESLSLPHMPTCVFQSGSGRVEIDKNLCASRLGAIDANRQRSLAHQFMDAHSVEARDVSARSVQIFDQPPLLKRAAADSEDDRNRGSLRLVVSRIAWLVAPDQDDVHF